VRNAEAESPADDSSIGDDEALWRWVRPDQWEPMGDSTRPRSDAFCDSSDGSPMSVDRAQVRQQRGEGPEHTVADRPGYLVAEVQAGSCRALHLGVVPDPLPDNPAHAGVTGTKTHSVRRQLAKAALWVPGFEPSP
jgi:hypothetical protein